MEYLGFILDFNGTRTNPDKAEGVIEAPPPTKCQSTTKFFRGRVNYYARFIGNMASIAAPLYEVLQKEVP